MTVGCAIRPGYVTLSISLSHVADTQASLQTAEHLTLASLGKSPLAPVPDEEKGDRANSQFVEDQSIPAMFRAKLQDYFRSGYDRGHM